MKIIKTIIISGLSISIISLLTLSNNILAYNQDVVKKISNRIEYLINKKTDDNYKKLSIYLKLKDRIEDYGTKKPKLKKLLKDILTYTDKNYIYKKLGFYQIDLDYVVDGDTIRFIRKDSGKKYSLRMIGIDTPESNKKRYGYVECYGDEAKEHLKGLLSNMSIKDKLFIEIDKTQGEVDKYGRTLGYLIRAYYKNGTYKIGNLNGRQIKDGYAWEYTYNKYHPYTYQKLFKQYQKYAEQRYLGLWNKNTCNGQRISVNKTKEQTNNDLYNILSPNLVGDDNKRCPTKKVYCYQIKNCDLAYYYLNQCKMTNLDRNKDGIPCENICGK